MVLLNLVNVSLNLVDKSRKIILKKNLFELSKLVHFVFQITNQKFNMKVGFFRLFPLLKNTYKVLTHCFLELILKNRIHLLLAMWLSAVV